MVSCHGRDYRLRLSSRYRNDECHYCAPDSRVHWEVAFGEESWNDEEHMIHGAKDIHEETDDELKESEEAAASNDPGMEAASEERAVDQRRFGSCCQDNTDQTTTSNHFPCSPRLCILQC